MPSDVSVMLMFTGEAEAAMSLYSEVFPGSAIRSIERYDEDQPSAAGTVKLASFQLHNQTLLFIDSPPVHEFTFTAATSLFVECVDETELQSVFDQLSSGGQVLMPLSDYGFSTKFGWLTDRFGVSWQLNLV